MDEWLKKYEQIVNTAFGNRKALFVEECYAMFLLQLHIETKHIIRLHKPHNNNMLKKYQIDQLIEELEKQGVI